MRLRGTEKLLVLVGCLMCTTTLSAQDVRIVQQNGTQFVESTRTVRQPVANTTIQRREETVYREEYTTQIQESQQTYMAPVTEYRWEPRVHGRLNPFRPKTVAYHLVPHTRWEPRTHTIRTPVTTRQLRPETRVVEIPHRQLGFSQQQQTTRTALAPSAAVAGSSSFSGSSFSGNTAAPSTQLGTPAAGSIAGTHHALPSAAPQSVPVAGSVGSSTTVSSGSPTTVPHTATLPSAGGVIGGVHQLEGDHPRFGTSTRRY